MSKSKIDRKSVVTRLRKTREAFEEAQYRDGFETGKNFAARQAEYGDLLCAEDWDGEDADSLLKAMNPNEDWKDILGDAYDNLNLPHFLRGFYDGMMEVWSDVQDEVEAA